MGRPHIEFIQSAAVVPVVWGDGPFAGSGRRVLSEDTESGASTNRVAVRAGWQGDLTGYERPVEIYVLRGALEVGGTEVRSDRYAFVPSGCTNGRLLARRAADLLVYVEGESSSTDTAVEIVDPASMPYLNPTSAGAPVGIVIKVLHRDPSTGDMTWLSSAVPGWEASHVEKHPTVEESFILRGDILLGELGPMLPGCYFWRPPDVLHGPMFSRDGKISIARTKGGSLQTTWHEHPDWQRIIAAYRETEPFFAGA